MKANRLTKLSIQFVSLVAAGANRREFLAKGEDEVAYEAQVDIRKVDEAKRWVTGILYPVGEVDTQKDFVTEADMDAAMAEFAAKGLTAAGRACDVDHDGQATGDYIAELYKVEAGDTRWPDPADAGAWVVTRAITDDARWAAVLDGTYKAFSFGGVAKRIPDQEVTKAADIPSFREAMKGRFQEVMAQMRSPHLIEVLGNALWDTYYSADPNTSKEELQAVIDEAALEFAKAGDPVVTPTRLSRLRALLMGSTEEATQALKTRAETAEARVAELEAQAVAAKEAADAEDTEADALLAEALQRADRLEQEVAKAQDEAAAAETARAAAEERLAAYKAASPGSARNELNNPPAAPAERTPSYFA